MSLTSELKDTASPIRQFLLQRFPNHRAVVNECKAALKDSETITPAGPIAYGTTGEALDYRIRFYFGITPAKELVAYHGAAQVHPDSLGLPLPGAPQRPTLPAELIDHFFTDLDRQLRTIRPVGRRLGAQLESRLNRYCYVLALFEELYRTRQSQLGSPLLVPTPMRSLPDMLEIPTSAALDDLCALSWAFHDTCHDLIRGARKIVLNPKIEGSGEVGGADADLILDGCLLEIKALINPIRDSARFRETLHQLLGYVLLDYGDHYKIRDVGIYLARQRVLLRWPLKALMMTMAGLPIAALADLRMDFREVAERLPFERKGGAATTSI